VQEVTTFRGDSNNDIIEEVNDPRNGFLLSLTLHALVGHGASAFIQTPNFGLNRSDLPPSPRIVATDHIERLTLQHFHDASIQTTTLAPQNEDACLPESLADWPPTLITNFVYGYAVVKCWGKKNSIDIIRKLARETYYNRRPLAQTTKQVADERHSDQSKARSDRFARRQEAHGSVEEERQEMDIDIMDVLMFLRHRSVVSNTRPMQQGPRPEDVSTEKVHAWLLPH